MSIWEGCREKMANKVEPVMNRSLTTYLISQIHFLDHQSKINLTTLLNILPSRHNIE